MIPSVTLTNPIILYCFCCVRVKQTTEKVIIIPQTSSTPEHEPKLTKKESELLDQDE